MSARIVNQGVPLSLLARIPELEPRLTGFFFRREMLKMETEVNRVTRYINVKEASDAVKHNFKSTLKVQTECIKELG